MSTECLNPHARPSGIGKPLEASVRLHAKDEASRELLDEVGSMNLSELFIVSQCLIKDEDSEEAEAVSGAGSNNPGLNISVIEAPGVKCRAAGCILSTRSPKRTLPALRGGHRRRVISGDRSDKIRAPSPGGR